MGNTTEYLDRTRATEVASRIGDHLAAQRVELFEFVDAARAELVARWSLVPARVDNASVSGRAAVPLAWFPWSLGNIRPAEYLFVRNAGALPLSTDEHHTISDLAMASVVHLPVSAGKAAAIGSVCAYWSEERSAWDSESRGVVCGWALDALSPRR